MFSGQLLCFVLFLTACLAFPQLVFEGHDELLCFVLFLTACLAFPQLVFEGHDEESTSFTNNAVNRTKRAPGACWVTLEDLGDKEPLFISRTALPKQLIRPEVVANKGVFTMSLGDSMLLACPGKQNKNSGTSQQSATLFCTGTTLFLDRQKATVQSMSCTKSYAGCSAKISSRGSCGGPGQPGALVELGFELDGGVWLPQVEICHNIDAMFTYYSSHKVYGHSLKGAVKDPTRKCFCNGNNQLFKNANMRLIYSKDNQIASFDKILGKGAGDHFIETNGGEKYLAKGHLAPDADFVYLSEQMLTYNFANAAPEWQKVNNGYWFNKLERFVRNLAVKLDLTLNVYTGTHGVLQLSYNNNQLKDIYLINPSNKSTIKIPVPKIFWKIVQHPTTKACTVVVFHNNIFLTAPPAPLCTPTTVPQGWPDYSQHPSLDKGYYYYCDANSFDQVVPTSPNLQCSGVFNA